MGRGRIAQERVENNCVVVFLRFVDVKSAIANGDVRGGGIEVEKFFGDWNDGGIDFDDIDADAFADEFAWDDADAHADAECVLEIGGVTPGEFVEHVGEEREADFGLWIVGVLDEEIVEVVAAVGGFVVENLEFAKVGIAAIEAGHVVKLVAQAIVNRPGAGENEDSEKENGEIDSAARGRAIWYEVNARKQQQDAGSDEHGGRVRQKWEQNVADENGAGDAAERADGGEASDLAADDLDRLSQHANDERAGCGEKRERHKKQKHGGEKGAFGQIQIQAGVSHFFTRDNAEGEVNGGGGDANIEAMKGRGAIDQPAAEVISQRERDQCDSDLSGPNKVRRPNVRRQHFGAENFHNEDGGAGDGSS